MDVNAESRIHQELERVGAILANRRVEQNLKIFEISKVLRIQPEYLSAIEKAEVDRLPAPAYIIGYIRSYANYLNLPAAELCQAMQNALGHEDRRPEFDFIENRALSPTGSGRVALASALAGVLLYAGWYVFDTGMVSVNNGQDERTAQAVVEEVVLPPQGEQIDDQQIGTDGAPIFREVEPRTQVIAPETEVAATADETPVIEQPAAGGAGEAVTDLAAAESSAAEDAAELPLAETTHAASAVPEATDQQLQLEEANLSASTAMAHNRDPESEMVITAIGTSWVELSRPDGSKIAAWLMRSGEVYTVSGDEDVYLTTGNAGGLSIALGNGETVIPGNWGEAIRELPLDAALIIDRNQ